MTSGSRRHLLALAGICTIGLNLPSMDANASSNCIGMWGVNAKPLFDSSGERRVPVKAPDGKQVVSASDRGIFLTTKSGSRTELTVVASPPLIEVLWAPDSSALAINASDGGGVGTWHVQVYSIDGNDQPLSRETQDAIEHEADEFARCKPREAVNVGAVAWLGGGKELLVVAEVPPHSSCDNMGAITAFRVSVSSGKVVARLSEGKVRAQFGKLLGCRFVSSPAR